MQQLVGGVDASSQLDIDWDTASVLSVDAAEDDRVSGKQNQSKGACSAWSDCSQVYDSADSSFLLLDNALFHGSVMMLCGDNDKLA